MKEKEFHHTPANDDKADVFEKNRIDYNGEKEQVDNDEIDPKLGVTFACNLYRFMPVDEIESYTSCQKIT
jgi:hypothetical protein